MHVQKLLRSTNKRMVLVSRDKWFASTRFSRVPTCSSAAKWTFYLGKVCGYFCQYKSAGVNLRLKVGQPGLSKGLSLMWPRVSLANVKSVVAISLCRRRNALFCSHSKSTFHKRLAKRIPIYNDTNMRKVF